MLPAEQVRILNGAAVAFVGTRNRQLRPFACWAAAVRADAAQDTIAFVVPDNEGARVKSDLEDNGRVALTVVEPRSHEAYQFKGCYLSARPADEHDRALIDIQVAKIVARFGEMQMNGAVFHNFVFWPGSLVTFRVEDIFVQTPGPSAGKRIDFTGTSA